MKKFQAKNGKEQQRREPKGGSSFHSRWKLLECAELCCGGGFKRGKYSEVEVATEINVDDKEVEKNTNKDKPRMMNKIGQG